MSAARRVRLALAAALPLLCGWSLDPPGAPARACVELEIDAGDGPATLGEELRVDLDAELAVDDLSLSCPAELAPLARVELYSERALDDATAIEIRIDDAVTHKQLRRELSMAEIPADGRSLELTIVIVELLHASWAELLLPAATPASASTPPPQASEPPLEHAPPPVQRALSRRLAATERLRLALVAGLASRWLPRQLVLFSAVAGVELWPTQRVGLGLLVEGGGAPSYATPSGRVQTSGVWGRAQLELNLVRRSAAKHPWTLELAPGLVAGAVSVVGISAGEAAGLRSTRPTLDASLSLRTTIAFGPVALALALDSGWVLLGLDVLDRGVAVRNYGGLSLGGRVAVLVPLRRRMRR